MDLAASSSSATTTVNPAIEKAREKQRRKLSESISGLKVEDQIEFLLSRLAESEITNGEQKRDTERLKRENSKLNLKLDSTQKLLSKTEVAKSKLEQLCRELNKAHREEKEHNQLKLNQMKIAHADTVETFKKTLADLQQNMEASHEHSKRVADVERLSNNLNQMAADYEFRLNELKLLYEVREKDLNKMVSEKDTELNGMKAQIDDVQKHVNDVLVENISLKRELLAKDERLKQSIEAEMSLRKILDDYSHKYGELTESLNQSNSSFDKIKGQMGKMNANLIKVQADAKKWKGKAEEANKVATTITLEKMETDKLLALKDRQLVQMQELCRRLKNVPSLNTNVLGNEENCLIKEKVLQKETADDEKAECNGATITDGAAAVNEDNKAESSSNAQEVTIYTQLTS